jgi:hypothetical protein
MLCPSDYDDYVDDYLLQFHEFYWGTERAKYEEEEISATALDQIFGAECLYNPDFQFEDYGLFGKWTQTQAALAAADEAAAKAAVQMAACNGEIEITLAEGETQGPCTKTCNDMNGEGINNAFDGSMCDSGSTIKDIINGVECADQDEGCVSSDCCDLDPVVETVRRQNGAAGCTDSFATNYISVADSDDGSCLYKMSIQGVIAFNDGPAEASRKAIHLNVESNELLEESEFTKYSIGVYTESQAETDADMDLINTITPPQSFGLQVTPDADDPEASNRVYPGDDILIVASKTEMESYFGDCLSEFDQVIEWAGLDAVLNGQNVVQLYYDASETSDASDHRLLETFGIINSQTAYNADTESYDYEVQDISGASAYKDTDGSWLYSEVDCSTPVNTDTDTNYDSACPYLGCSSRQYFSCLDYELNGWCSMEDAVWECDDTSPDQDSNTCTEGRYTNVQGPNWLEEWGTIDEQEGRILVASDTDSFAYSYMKPTDACCICGADARDNCGCPDNAHNYVGVEMKVAFDMYVDREQCEWMTVCQYDCEVCGDDDSTNDVRCSEVLATDPNVVCGRTYEDSQQNIKHCGIKGGLIYTNEAGGVAAPPVAEGVDGEYCDDSCEICGWGGAAALNDDGTPAVDTDGNTVIAEYFTSANDCIRCAKKSGERLKLNVDFTQDTGVGTCEDDSWNYQADLPVPEQCECSYKWTGCKQYTGPRQGYKDMSATDCKAEVRAKVEGYMRTIGIVSLIICGIFIGIMFITAIAIDQWRDEQDEEEVEVVTQVYVDGKLVEQTKEEVIV